MTDIESSVLAFIRDEQPDHSIALDTELMEAGILDSIALIKMIQFIESTFGVSVPDSDIDPDIFASPKSIASYVARRSGVTASPAEAVPAE